MLEQKEALIVVKTYPTPSKTGVETSCTAAITRTGEWLRLFPVPFRRLEEDQRFRRYQWVRVSVTKASDARPESYKLDWIGSAGSPIEILSEPLPTDHQWRARKEIIFPLRAHCMCCLRRDRKARKFPTLGIFRPRSIRRLVIEQDEPQWSDAQLDILRQGSLFEDNAPPRLLEKIPLKFSYEFTCDETTCRGHTMMCSDWEMAESWRKWKDSYGDDWESKFRMRYEQDMIQRRDTHFYVGTLNKHPDNWIIVGLFYPPPVDQPDLYTETV